MWRHTMPQGLNTLARVKLCPHFFLFETNSLITLQLRPGEAIVHMLTFEAQALSLKFHYKGLSSHPSNPLSECVSSLVRSLSA